MTSKLNSETPKVVVTRMLHNSWIGFSCFKANKDASQEDKRDDEQGTSGESKKITYEWSPDLEKIKAMAEEDGPEFTDSWALKRNIIRYDP